MKVRYLHSSLVALVATTGLVFGQTPQTASSEGLRGGKSPFTPGQQVSATVPEIPAPADPGADTATALADSTDHAPSWPSDRFWATADYLLWWTKDGKLPAVVGTAPSSLANVSQLPTGAINPIFGGLGPHLDFEEHSGARIAAGYWLDVPHTLGLDAAYFQLDRKAIRFTASSAGEPLLGPVYDDPVLGRQVIIIAASPGSLNGRVDVTAGERFWGAEANVRTACCTVFSDRFEVFAGFRHLQLDESLTINTNATVLPNVPVIGGSNFNFNDNFGTHNRFYGPQVGLATEYHWDRWALNLIGKIAIGDINQIINISGFSTMTQPGAPTNTQVGGVLALPTNIGHHTRDHFSAVPEATLNLSYQVTSFARAFIGYNFLMVTDVVRPGDQIDAVDGRQIPLLSSFDPTVRATRPVVHFNQVDYWAQGFNFGMEFRY